MRRILDYPLGKVSGRQALAVRITDSTIHTWDLAQALDVDDTLHAELVTWISDRLGEIYADLAETPIDPESTHRFFAAPTGSPGVSKQERLLHRMGRSPLLASGRGRNRDTQLTAPADPSPLSSRRSPHTCR